MPDSAFFAPWSLGARVCPGKKFSQVEFVAVLLHMLADWRIETVRGEGEAETEARERVLNVLERKTFNVSVHLVRPEEVRLRFVRREV
jgi:cytochrome P450